MFLATSQSISLNCYLKDLKKARQPLLYLEALYLVRPSKDNIDRIKKDFSQVQCGVLSARSTWEQLK